MDQIDASWVDKIRKRDGRIVPFDKRKIASAIYKASMAVGSPDSNLAEDLSEAVTIYLNHHYYGRVPSVEEIQDIVEKVLIRTGHDRMAKAYILYRQKRAEVRRKTGRVATAEAEHVGHSRHVLDGPVHLDIMVQTSEDDITTWDRKRIVDVLVREVGLDGRFAEAISIEVEQEVMYKKLRCVTTNLIRELVDGKLLEYGLHDATKLHGRLGLPLYDVAATVSGRGPFSATTLGPASTSAQIAGSVKRQFAFLKVLPQSLVSGHTRGEIHVRGLWGIDRLDKIQTTPEDLHKVVPEGHIPGASTELSSLILSTKVLSPFLSRTLTWRCDQGDALAPLFSQPQTSAGALGDLILFLSQPIEDSPILGLRVPAQDSPSCPELARLILQGSLDMYSRRLGWYPRALSLGLRRFSVGEDLAGISTLCLDALAQGYPLNFHVLPQEDRCLEERPCLLRVTLNLARLAFLAGSDENRLYEELENLVDLSASGYRAKRDFLRMIWGVEEYNGLQSNARSFLLQELSGSVLEIGVCGLEESVSSFLGSRFQEDQEGLSLAKRIVEALVRICHRQGERHGFPVLASPDPSISAPRRFSRLDLDQFPKHSTRVVRIDPATGGVSYTSGLCLAPESVLDPWERIRMEAEFSSPLRSGMSLDIQVPREIGATELSRILSEAFAHPHVSSVQCRRGLG